MLAKLAAQCCWLTPVMLAYELVLLATTTANVELLLRIAHRAPLERLDRRAALHQVPSSCPASHRFVLLCLAIVAPLGRPEALGLDLFHHGANLSGACGFPGRLLPSVVLLEHGDVCLELLFLLVLLSLIHISEPTRLLSISYAVFCLKKKKKKNYNQINNVS
eukprot:TRINITY_DN2339_c0_g1_i9.p1 TRINITY_DN2339_c0_g1~~TRINITY_DN2339_c0_g1_i9.p1  ORF type:complete len:163 (+),score=13.73 TRINITY_DN2339_c0_g1_i9:336-824(+)